MRGFEHVFRKKTEMQKEASKEETVLKIQKQIETKLLEIQELTAEIRELLTKPE